MSRPVYTTHDDLKRHVKNPPKILVDQRIFTLSQDLITAMATRQPYATVLPTLAQIYKFSKLEPDSSSDHKLAVNRIHLADVMETLMERQFSGLPGSTTMTSVPQRQSKSPESLPPLSQQDTLPLPIETAELPIAHVKPTVADPRPQEEEVLIIHETFTPMDMGTINPDDDLEEVIQQERDCAARLAALTTANEAQEVAVAKLDKMVRQQAQAVDAVRPDPVPLPPLTDEFTTRVTTYLGGLPNTTTLAPLKQLQVLRKSPSLMRALYGNQINPLPWEHPEALIGAVEDWNKYAQQVLNCEALHRRAPTGVIYNHLATAYHYFGRLANSKLTYTPTELSPNVWSNSAVTECRDAIQTASVEPLSVSVWRSTSIHQRHYDLFQEVRNYLEGHLEQVINAYQLTPIVDLNDIVEFIGRIDIDVRLILNGAKPYARHDPKLIASSIRADYVTRWESFHHDPRAPYYFPMDTVVALHKLAPKVETATEMQQHFDEWKQKYFDYFDAGPVPTEVLPYSITKDFDFEFKEGRPPVTKMPDVHQIFITSPPASPVPNTFKRPNPDRGIVPKAKRSSPESPTTRRKRSTSNTRQIKSLADVRTSSPVTSPFKGPVTQLEVHKHFPALWNQYFKAEKKLTKGIRTASTYAGRHLPVMHQNPSTKPCENPFPCPNAHQDIIRRAIDHFYRDNVCFSARITLVEFPNGLNGTEHLFLNPVDEQSAWDLCCAAVHLDNLKMDFFIMAYPQHPYSLLRKHTQPLAFYELDYPATDASNAKVPMSVDCNRLLLVIENLAVLYQNEQVMNLFKDFSPAADEQTQLASLQDILEQLALIYDRSRIRHTVFINRDATNSPVTHERPARPITPNAFVLNLPEIICWLYKRLFDSPKMVFANHLELENYTISYQQAARKTVDGAKPTSEQTDRQYSVAPLYYGPAYPIQDGTDLPHYLRRYRIPSTIALGQTKRQHKSARLLHSYDNEAYPKGNRVGPSRLDEPPETTRDFWFNDGNLCGNQLIRVVQLSDANQREDTKNLHRKLPPFLHRDSINKIKVPKDHINVLHIGDANMPFLASKLGHSAISTPKMEPFEMITVLLRDDILFDQIHAIHLQFGQYELVTLPKDYNVRGSDAELNRQKLLTHINQLRSLLPLKIVDNLKAAHRLATARDVPIVMVSTWAPYGHQDLPETQDVKEAIDRVIFAVNEAIKAYANSPLPLRTFVFVVDVWRDLASRLAPQYPTPNPVKYSHIFNFKATGGYGIRLTEVGTLSWADEFTNSLHVALGAYSNHDETHRNHTVVYPLQSVLGRPMDSHSQAEEELMNIPQSDTGESDRDSAMSYMSHNDFYPPLDTTASGLPPFHAAGTSKDPIVIRSPPYKRSNATNSSPASPMAMDMPSPNAVVQPLTFPPNISQQLASLPPPPQFPTQSELELRRKILAETLASDLGQMLYAELIAKLTAPIATVQSEPQAAPDVPKPPPKRLRVIKDKPIQLALPSNPKRAIVSTRQTGLDLNTSTFRNLPIPPEVRHLVYVHFHEHADSPLCSRIHYTTAQQTTVNELSSLPKTDPNEPQEIDTYCNVPLNIHYCRDSDAWEEYLQSLNAPQRNRTLKNANEQCINCSRHITILLQTVPFTHLTFADAATNGLFHYDPHQPFLYTLLQEFQFLAQFQISNGNELDIEDLIVFYNDFEPNLNSLAHLNLPRSGSIYPSTLLLLIWGQFAQYYWDNRKKYLSPAEWLHTYPMATVYFDRHFMDNGQHFPFPLIM